VEATRAAARAGRTEREEKVEPAATRAAAHGVVAKVVERVVVARVAVRAVERVVVATEAARVVVARVVETVAVRAEEVRAVASSQFTFTGSTTRQPSAASG